MPPELLEQLDYLLLNEVSPTAAVCLLNGCLCSLNGCFYLLNG